MSVGLSAVDTSTDVTQHFACSYTVDSSSGVITAGSCAQTGSASQQNAPVASLGKFDDVGTLTGSRRV